MTIFYLLYAWFNKKWLEITKFDFAQVQNQSKPKLVKLILNALTRENFLWNK